MGISNYNALQFNVNKRFSHGFMVTGSYTYSHTLDEQKWSWSLLQRQRPNDPRSSYGSSDFDRTHVFTVNYHYEFPSACSNGVVKQVVNGWGLNGTTVLQSGQPYSVVDFSGGAAGIYWGAKRHYKPNRACRRFSLRSESDSSGHDWRKCKQAECGGVRHSGPLHARNKWCTSR